MTEESLKKPKPILRGYFHQEAFFVALGACLLLIFKNTSSLALAATSIYSVGLLMLFGVSALYHRKTWQPRGRAIMKKFDHAAIFILIAGSFTPICLFALPSPSGLNLLLLVWITALVGIIQSFFWTKAPKWLSAIFYVGMGWVVVPYLGLLRDSLGLILFISLVAGGVAYTIGAVFYATKRPKLKPHVFGYHELFHLFTIVGAVFHFIVVYQLMS